MQCRVLGCSADITQGEATTCLRIDDDILIDAGTGLGDLTLEEMARIRRVFITHSHLDHIALLPLMLDSLFEHLDEPIIVHGREETLQALRQHVFNWVLWPDFPQLPEPDRPVVRLEPMAPEEEVVVGDRTVRMLPGHHAVPAAAYQIRTAEASLVFTGDMTTNTVFWESVNRLERLDHLIIECAFPNRLQWLAEAAYHYCPRLLAADLDQLRHDPVLWLTHRGAAEKESILTECRAAIGNREVRPLDTGGQIGF